MVVSVVLPKVDKNSSEDGYDYDDVIDLGAPSAARKRQHCARHYSPNPRLYPRQPQSKSAATKRHQPRDAVSRVPTKQVKRVQSLHSPQRRSSLLESRLKPRVKNRSPQQTRGARAGGASRTKRVKHVARSVVPNSRLYTPPPPALRRRPPPPPPQRPRASWSPPPSKAPQQTASQIALHFAEGNVVSARELLPPARKVSVEKPRKKTLSPVSKPAKRVLRPRAKTLPLSQQAPSEAPDLEPAVQRYRPCSAHFRSLDTDALEYTELLESPESHQPTCPAPPPPPGPPLPELTLHHDIMAASPHLSASPEDGSDGNDSMSAPSEYLAEFLSSIMTRNYEAALKYCRLILQYEPNNKTARGFYPLLRHKVDNPSPERGAAVRRARPAALYLPDGKPTGSSGSESGSSGPQLAALETASEGDDQSADESVDLCAELSLDSSGKSSRSASPAVHADRGSSSWSMGSAETEGDEPASAHAPTDAQVTTTRAGCWLAAGALEHDDNGNPRAPDPHPDHSRTHHRTRKHNNDDLENDNAAGGDHKLLIKDPTLQQLRAQFACSIK